MWEQLARELESVGLVNLTWEGCSSIWSDMKKRAKKYSDKKKKTGEDMFLQYDRLSSICILKVLWQMVYISNQNS